MGADDTVIAGIKYFEKTDVDTIIIGRGGGSIEELWAFNSEKLARVIALCTKPIISAVGHETDVTIADFAADLRGSNTICGSRTCCLFICRHRSCFKADGIYY